MWFDRLNTESDSTPRVHARSPPPRQQGKTNSPQTVETPSFSLLSQLPRLIRGRGPVDTYTRVCTRVQNRYRSPSQADRAIHVTLRLSIR